MDYQTFKPHTDLEPIVNCYWTLEIPADKDAAKQRIVPDGCLEMAFILGDDIKRFVSEDEYIIQPRAMVLGQTIEPFFIQPTGRVKTFAIRFYPYGFANFISTPIKDLINTETPLNQLFEEQVASDLAKNMIDARTTAERIEIIEAFLLERLVQEQTIGAIFKSTLEAIIESKGSSSVHTILKSDPTKRRQLERNFSKNIGLSPKQLGKIIRMQSALKMLLSGEADSLTQIAYDSSYYDQAHFIKDFKEFTGTNPSDFIDNKTMELSSQIYSRK